MQIQRALERDPHRSDRPMLFNLLALGWRVLRNLSVSYRPDAHVHFGHYQEYETLHRRFLDGNRLNNWGDTPRLWSFLLNISQVLEEGVPGAFAELGVFRGNTAAILAHYASESDREVYLFDTFRGFDARDLRESDHDRPGTFSSTSVEQVARVIGTAFDTCHVVQGYFPDSLQASHDPLRFAVVSLDCDLYAPMRAGLAWFYPRLSPGGMLMIHDYANPFWPGVKQAVAEFCDTCDAQIVLLPDKSGTAIIRKPGRSVPPARATEGP